MPLGSLVVRRRAGERALALGAQASCLHPPERQRRRTLNASDARYQGMDIPSPYFSLAPKLKIEIVY